MRKMYSPQEDSAVAVFVNRNSTSHTLKGKCACYLLNLAFIITTLTFRAEYYGILCLNIFYYVDEGSQAMIQKANTIHNFIQL